MDESPLFLFRLIPPANDQILLAKLPVFGLGTLFDLRLENVLGLRAAGFRSLWQYKSAPNPVSRQPGGKDPLEYASTYGLVIVP